MKAHSYGGIYAIWKYNSLLNQIKARHSEDFCIQEIEITTNLSRKQSPVHISWLGYHFGLI